jgi:hypothetical protein
MARLALFETRHLVVNKRDEERLELLGLMVCVKNQKKNPAL